MNITAERIFGRHAEIKVSDMEIRHMRYPEDQQRYIYDSLSRRVPMQCESCPKLERATSRSWQDMGIYALARCSMEKNGGGICPDGMPVGSHKVQIVFHDDESMGESHVRIFDHDGLKGMSEEDRRKVIELAATYPSPRELTVGDFRREWLNQPVPNEIMPLKSDPINHDMPQTCGEEAW